ncbi:hydroxymethylglutaryl-CoA synthase family protein [Tritrichomonas foetus]|uniref:Hydroxymethylglutaryl-CoA synthase n=1 Tax=Tritrichomonas foetus TaxID=1144522 RepID=A0A1J4K468_9EUKA|nr:hydroxymethylglutaryl-CoA synthase family protein [Tritrichomonas foetus]|eukprot:OHT05754.1 hydroxymethylglutaryl-CoA synthase family protein [Tritrichomonas foetus]
MQSPKNIGIRAIEVHFPKNFILQDHLEDRDIEILGEDQREKIKGKYTKGLGQTALSFCTDHEDTVSIAMNAIQSLFDKYNLDESMFGRLEIGTESGIDRSKSIKSFLMQLFPTNHTLMGVDNTNACYGGTAALLNSLAWMESSQWDGRLALVVCTDIAVYEEMASRPTGGCGAVAMAIGPDAPIVFEPGLLSHHFVHGYDFYKPNPANPHPLVDGPLSLLLYYECLDYCYFGYRQKCFNQIQHQNVDKSVDKITDISVDNFDYICLHNPFQNHIKKCTGRLAYLKDKNGDEPEIDETRKNPRFMSELSATHRPLFNEKVSPSCRLSMFCGNGYTSSLYLAIASLIDSVADMNGKRVLCFSYGSGAASSMFSFRVNGDISNMRKNLNLEERLSARNQRTVIEYEKAIELENLRFKSAPYNPSDSLDLLWDKSWYLESIDEKWMRHYKRKE